MMDKISKSTFLAVFLLMLTLPLVTINLRRNTISAGENRTLTQFPDFYGEDGKRKQSAQFHAQLEAWINDNIGFRSRMVVANAKLQYYLFGVLSNNTDYYLGPGGELNYATEAMLADYQHLNLRSEENLKQIAEGFQSARDYLTAKGIQMYYFQCWDKHSIYPEYFPKSVIQYGEESKTDGIVEALAKWTDVDVVSPKAELIAWKSRYETYSKWGDATHWTQRGAFIGYQMLMKAITDRNGGRYRILQESDYDITETDQGSTIFGGIHKVCMLENFTIKNPQAYRTDEKLTLLGEDPRHSFWTNDRVDNDTRVLILGDSYINSFIRDDIAESFHETIMIWGDYSSNFIQMIEEFEPDIVIIENAERCDRTEGFAGTMKEFMQSGHSG